MMVVIVAVMFVLGIAVVLNTGRGSGVDKRVTKLPMPIQKAIARPAINPVTAP